MHGFIVMALCFLLAAPLAYGHGTSAGKADIVLEEKLGQYLSADAVFLDENGGNVKQDPLRQADHNRAGLSPLHPYLPHI
jgi:hypothetical protein